MEISLQKIPEITTLPLIYLADDVSALIILVLVFIACDVF